MARKTKLTVTEGEASKLTGETLLKKLLLLWKWRRDPILDKSRFNCTSEILNRLERYSCEAGELSYKEQYVKEFIEKVEAEMERHGKDS